MPDKRQAVHLAFTDGRAPQTRSELKPERGQHRLRRLWQIALAALLPASRRHPDPARRSRDP